MIWFRMKQTGYGLIIALFVIFVVCGTFIWFATKAEQELKVRCTKEGGYPVVIRGEVICLEPGTIRRQNKDGTYEKGARDKRLSV